MAAPVLVLTSPADEDVGTPVGVSILLYFTNGVDLKSVEDNIVLTSASLDRTSGAEATLYINKQSGENPYFLTSPGFKGIVPLDVTLSYYTIDTTTVVDPGVITSEDDEETEEVGHLVTLTPKLGTLAPDVQHTLYITGDPEDLQKTGLSSRTVFDTEPGGGNVGVGTIATWGTWTGNSADTMNIKITTAGDPNTAKYKYWYTSQGEGSAVVQVLTSRRFRTLVDGLQIRFLGTGFTVNDTYSFNLEPITRMETSTKIVFTTNDGTYTAPPDSPSVPAESQPPSTVLPTSTASAFYVTEMLPENASYNVNPRKTRTIVLTFSDDIDADTVTDDTITLWAYPVDGHYDNTSAPRELSKSIEVEDNQITIKY